MESYFIFHWSPDVDPQLLKIVCIFTVFSILFLRNARLEQMGLKFPKAYKTGTTIAGVIYKVNPVLIFIEKKNQATATPNIP